MIRRLTALTVLAAVPSGAVFAADARHGGDLSRRWCASCHIVSADQKQASPDVPSFIALARRADFDKAAITNFLRDPHPKMPDLSLTRAESEDIAAYIESLAK